MPDTPQTQPEALAPTRCTLNNLKPNPKPPKKSIATLHTTPKKMKNRNLHTTQKTKIATLQTHNSPLENRTLHPQTNPKLNPLTHSPPTQHTAYPSRATNPCRMQVLMLIPCRGRGGMQYGGPYGIRYLGLYRDAVKRQRRGQNL